MYLSLYLFATIFLIDLCVLIYKNINYLDEFVPRSQLFLLQLRLMKKKILHICTHGSSDGGAQKRTISFVEKTPNSYTVILASGSPYDSFLSHPNFIPLAFLKRNIGIYDFICLFELVKLFICVKPDFILLHSNKSLVLGRFVVFILRFFHLIPSVSVICFVHGWGISPSNRLAFWTRNVIENFQVKWSSLYVYENQFDSMLLPATLGIPFVVETSVEDFGCCYSPRLTDSFHVVSVGRLSPQKDFDSLIRAFRYLPDNYILSIVGDGVDNSRLQDLATNEGVFSRIAFLGELDFPSMIDMISVADLYAQISHHEGSPLSLLHAISLGIPSIASCVGGCPEILMQRKELLLSTNNPISISTMIKNISNLPADQQLCLSRELRSHYLSFYKDLDVESTLSMSLNHLL